MDAVVKYDADADVLYVRLSTAKISRTVELDDLRNIDVSAEGSVVGIEFVCASDGVDLADIPFHDTVLKAIGNSGLNIKVFA